MTRSMARRGHSRPNMATEENMAKIRKLLHTRYRVNDLEKTVAFYRDVLGLQETGRHKSPRGSELVFMKAPGSEEEIELCCYPASGPVKVPPDLTHLAFEVATHPVRRVASCPKSYRRTPPHPAYPPV